MPVRLMTARFDGRCAECGTGIAKGTLINYGGRGSATHSTCRPLVRTTRHGRPQVVGGVENTGRRCEDAPCCGCC